MKAPDDPRRHFAEKVAQLQRERGFSQEALAARAKLDPAELEAILRGEDEVALDAVFLLAGALGVKPGELLVRIAWDPDSEKGRGGYRLDDHAGD